MNRIQELKAKATAAELTLIEAVESATRDAIALNVRKSIHQAAQDFCRSNRISPFTNPDDWQRSFAQAIMGATPDEK